MAYHAGIMFELILIVVLLLVIFGGGKLREAGSDLGAAVKGVRKALRRAAPAAAHATEAASASLGAADDARRGTPRPGVPADAEFPEVLAARENRRA